MNSLHPDVVVNTPWGHSDTLRSRRLRPGPGQARRGVERSQQERLYGATVAAVAEHGYEATRVADVLRVAGVSRSAFYRYFANKQECFVATIDALTGICVKAVADNYDSDGPPDEVQLEAVLVGLVELVFAYPAAARVWFMEVYAAGPEAIDRIESFTELLENFVVSTLDQTLSRAGMPRDGVRAVIGGLRQLIQNRLRRGEAEKLPDLVPELVSWTFGYRPPGGPLPNPQTPPAIPVSTPVADDLQRRIYAAVAGIVTEKGYQATTISDVAQRAAISLSTFYANYGSKHEAFIAAVDDGYRQIHEVVQPAFELNPDWRAGIRDGVHTLLAFNAGNPALATMCWSSVFAAGNEGFEHHARATERLQALLLGRSDAPPLVGDVIANAITAMIYQRVRRGGVERLYDLAAAGTYLALDPLAGAGVAFELADQEWRPMRLSGGRWRAAPRLTA